MNSLSVAVANLPTESLALTAELAEPGPPLLPGAPLLVLLLFEFLRVPTTTPTTIPTMATTTRSGIPNFIHLLIGFLPGAGD